MEVVKDKYILQEKLARINPDSIGLIQTKGAMHEGHQSLIEAARRENDIVVVVKLIHPKEFMMSQAYELYPRQEEEDKHLASLSGADFFFCPEADAVYNNESGLVMQLKETLSADLNGKYIPYSHKLTITMCLMNIIKPQRFYISDKDLQMVYLTKELFKTFHYNCELRVLAKVQDEDGIILNAKNKYLRTDEKNQLIGLYRILQKAQRAYEKGMISSKKIKWHIENEVKNLYLCQLEFVEIIEPKRLTRIETITDGGIVLIAVRLGKVRIHDYIVLKN